MAPACRAFRFYVPPARWQFAGLVLGWVAALLNARGADELPLAFQATPASRVTISGHATIGSWMCETNEVVAAIEPGPQLEGLSHHVRGSLDPSSLVGAAWRHDLAAATPQANVTIPVASLRCGKPGMRDDVLRALRSEEAPLIVFLLTRITDVRIEANRGASLGRYGVTAEGDLVLAGRSRRLEIAAEVSQETPTQFRVRATKSIRMSEFGITPPSALFGLIRADDTVTVTFDLAFEAVTQDGRAADE